MKYKIKYYFADKSEFEMMLNLKKTDFFFCSVWILNKSCLII